jgi:hypothetical protein
MGTQDKVDYVDKNEVFSKAVRAGKRTYFFDVKATKGSEYYLTITESKKITDEDGKFFFEKHKIFLYREDFEKFMDGMTDTMTFINNCSGESHINHSRSFADIECEDLEK